jgi:hypothetical protein
LGATQGCPFPGNPETLLSGKFEKLEAEIVT